MCAALIEQPDRAWSVAELERVTGEFEEAGRVLDELGRLGAVEFFWVPPHPVRPVHPLDGRYPQSVRSLRLTGEGAAIIRSRLDSGRPQGVISTFLWEGGSSAAAVWQAKRRQRAWKRSRRSN